MHRMRNEPKTRNGPETTGVTIHWASEYDIFTSLMGLGVNRPNSRMVIELAGIKPSDQVLDVGCGTGNLTLTAKSVARAVSGIDASPEMIAVAREKALRTRLDVTFQIGLIEKIPFPDASFDVVLSRLVIHHLPDDLKRLAFVEILRVLKPGGRLLIADFNPPKNPLLNHLACVLVGPEMMQTSVWHLSPILSNLGYINVSSGPTRSAFLAFMRGEKPAR